MTDATQKLVRWRLRLSKIDFEVVLLDGVKHQVADALCRLPKIGMDASLLEDDIMLLTITQAQPEEEKTKIDATIWQSLPGNESLDTVRPDLPKVFTSMRKD